jgi:hypothetical protein
MLVSQFFQEHPELTRKMLGYMAFHDNGWSQKYKKIL